MTESRSCEKRSMGSVWILRIDHWTINIEDSFFFFFLQRVAGEKCILTEKVIGSCFSFFFFYMREITACLYVDNEELESMS